MRVVLSRAVVWRSPLIALCLLALVVAVFPASAFGARATPQPKPSPIAAVIQVTIVSADRAAAVVRELFPNVRVRVDGRANAIVVMGPPDDVQSARSVISGIDVKNPSTPTVQVVQLRVLKPQEVVARVAPLFPGSSITVASKTSVLLRATPLDSGQITALISSLDVPPASAAPATPSPVEAVDVKIAQPKTIARAVASQVRGVQISVSGSSLLIKGDPQAVASAKALVAELDTPAFGARYTLIYRIKNVDAASVGDLIQRTFPNAKVTVDKDLNSLSVFATAAEHARIADGIAQIDGGTQSNGAGGGAGAAYGSSNVEVVQLNSAIPGQNNAPSTTAQDIASAVTQSLGQMAPGLHVTVPQNSDEIILAGDPTSIRLAKDLIAKLDVSPRLVELDTEVLELDETAVRNVGLQLPGAVLSTTFTEVLPTPDPTTGITGRLTRINPITRTPLSLTAQLNFLAQNGNGRVLADPRIATLSGHTASIRAGDTLAILTTTGGGVGTPVTQQLQTFNTGVTLDITPQVATTDDITVALHPVVNSLSGILNGVPQIATRDTQTVVHLHNNQTLVIGGLIQEADTKNITSIPGLGSIPLIGGLFRNRDTNVTRNELVIVVTPHIIRDGESPPPPNATMGLPTPAPLPTLPPDQVLPNQHQGATPAPFATPVLATPTPMPTLAPQPTPSAFAASNAFEYGTAPQNNYAGPQDSPQIFYARLQPTVIGPTTTLQIDAITTTNIKSVTIGLLGRTILLRSVGTGKWRATFPGSQLSLSSAQQTTMLSLNAYRADGIAASIQIPVSPLTTLSP